MDESFESRVRAATPQDADYLRIHADRVLMVELPDGRLMQVSPEGRRHSVDGGVTWGEPEPMRDAAGQPVERGHPILLPSGGLGLLYSDSRDRRARYGMDVWFRRSDDEGRTWSQPVEVSEPHNNAWIGAGYGPPVTVTSGGRIVVAAWAGIGKTESDRATALYGDRWTRTGSHGWESFFRYSWAYYSDDEGRTWHVSEGKGVHGGGGELFITLDYGAGGAHSCEEPVVTDVSPGHLLMFHRTGLGRFYQSWSADDGANWTQPEPTSLATAQAPAALRHIPGTDDLLLIWNQSSADEIWRGRQRHRLSSAISRDGGATWQHGRNVFSVEDGDGVTTRIEAPPIEYYRAMEHSPRQPPGDLVGTYPCLAFWRDRAIVTFRCFDRSRYLLDAPLPQRPQSLSAAQAGRAVCVSVGLPISWFYA